MRFTIIFAFIISLGACNKSVPRVRCDASITNATDDVLRQVSVNWSGPYIPGGTMNPGIAKTAAGIACPAPQTAVLEFRSGSNGEQHRVAFDVPSLPGTGNEVIYFEIVIHPDFTVTAQYSAPRSAQ